MKDIVCDTNITAEIIKQYYQANKFYGFSENAIITHKLKYILNKKIYEPNTSGYIIASSFAFIEIARKYKEIISDKIKVHQFMAFIQQPPEWFLIEPIDINLLEQLRALPPYNSENKPIEWADAIHAATALNRENACFVTTDSKLLKIGILKPLLEY
jgi:predicted nucleic acid-binding protein